MKKLLPALVLLLNVSAALAVPAYEENSTSSRPVVVQTLNNASRYPTVAPTPAVTNYVVLHPQAYASQPGIGPSSTMQPGDYGYSMMNDLRQLNF